MDIVDFGWLWKNAELSDFTLVIKPIRRGGPEQQPPGADAVSGAAAAAASGRAPRRARGRQAAPHAAAAAGGAAGVTTRRGAAAAPLPPGNPQQQQQQQQQDQQLRGRREHGRRQQQEAGDHDQERVQQERPAAEDDDQQQQQQRRQGPPPQQQEHPQQRRTLRARRRGLVIAEGPSAAAAVAGAAAAGPACRGARSPPLALLPPPPSPPPPPAGRITRGAGRSQRRSEERQSPRQLLEEGPEQPPTPRRRRRGYPGEQGGGQAARGPATAAAAAAAAAAEVGVSEGRAGTGPSSLAAAAAGEAGAGVRRIPVHAAVLSGMSPYFKVLVRNWSGGLVDRTITLEVGEEEGYAAELMVEFMYTGRLPQDAPPTELLRMIRLADQYQVQRFLSACNASFDGLPLDRIDLAVALSVFGLPPLMLESEALAKVVRKVEQKVQAVFGDLEQVWASESSREEFMQLPFRAVLSLLASEETAVHSENTVVVALAGWLELGAGRRATVDQRRQLVELVRLPFLTSSFIGDILPGLQWMREVLDQRTLLAAFQFAVASEATRARLAAEFTGHPASPPGMRHYRAPRPSSSVTKLVFDWSIELAAVKRMVADARLWNRVVEAHSPLHYFAGFYWQLLFNVERTAATDAAAGGAGAGAGGNRNGGAGGPGGANQNGQQNGPAGAGGGAGAGPGGGAGNGGNGGGGGGADGGGAAGSNGAVIEFVGVRCHSTLGMQDSWPRVVRFKANISALQTGFWDMEYAWGKALEGVIQDGVGLGYPGYFALPSGQLDSDGAWGRFVRAGRVHLRCEILECE